MFKFFKFGKSEPPTPGNARKQRSIATLKRLGVPVAEHLPRIEDETESSLRSMNEVLRRARARSVHFMRSQAAIAGASYEEYRHRMNSANAWDDLTPDERVVATARELTEQQKVDSSWAFESIVALVWAMGLSDELAWPTAVGSPQVTMPLLDKAASADGLYARCLAEVLDQADLYYRLHWACNEWGLRGKETPAGLISSVIVERRRALDWIHQAVDWDDVDMST